MSAYMSAGMHRCNTNGYTRIHARMHVYVYIYMCVCEGVYIHIHAHVCIENMV